MHRNAYFVLLVANLLWGGNVVAGKLAVGHVSPMLLTTLRWTGAFLVLLPFGWRNLVQDWREIRANLAYLAIMGALAMGIYNAMIYSAVNYTTAINVSILQAVIPMVVFAANFLAYRVRLGFVQFIGFLVTVFGLLLIAGEGTVHKLLHLEVNPGDGIMIVAVFLYGGYIVALRRMPRIHWQSMMLVMFASAAFVSIFITAGEFSVGAMQLPDRTGALVVLYAIIFPSIISQTLMVRGTEMIGANRAGLFINLIPVFGTLLSIVILSERFYLYHALSLGLVLFGIALAERFRPANAELPHSPRSN